MYLDPEGNNKQSFSIYTKHFNDNYLDHGRFYEHSSDIGFFTHSTSKSRFLRFPFMWIRKIDSEYLK